VERSVCVKIYHGIGGPSDASTQILANLLSLEYWVYAVRPKGVTELGFSDRTMSG
jgi:hypothetical protein